MLIMAGGKVDLLPLCEVSKSDFGCADIHLIAGRYRSRMASRVASSHDSSKRRRSLEPATGAGDDENRFRQGAA